MLSLLPEVEEYEKEIEKLGGRIIAKEKYNSYGNNFQTMIYFDNGYGLSFIEGGIAYGLEAAVVTHNNKGYELCYDTPITDDVIPYMSDLDILPLIKEVANLEERI